MPLIGKYKNSMDISPSSSDLSVAKRHAKRALKMFNGGKVDQDEDLHAVQDEYYKDDEDDGIQSFSEGGIVENQYGISLEDENPDYMGSSSFEDQERIRYSAGASEEEVMQGDGPRFKDQYGTRLMFKGGIVNKPEMSAKFAKAIKMKRGY